MSKLRVLLLSLLFCGSYVASAQVRPLSSITGQVVAPGRANNALIEVSLEKAPNRLVSRTFTDTGGNFEFRSLDAGRYEVVVHLEGYQEAHQTVDIESAVELQTDPVDGDPSSQRVVLDTGLFNQNSGVYIVLNRLPAGSSSDPDLVALSRKYSKKIVEEYQKAIEDNRRGNTDKAADRLESLLKQAPDFYLAHNDLGGVYLKQQRYRDAEREYKRARDLNAQSALPLVNLGGLFLQEADANLEKNPDAVGGILDDALDVLEEAIKLEPHAAAAYYLLGTAYYKSAFYEEAEDNLSRALEIERSMPSARLMLINVYLRQEKWQNALDHIDIYVMENPTAPNRSQLQEVRSKVVANLQEDRK